MIQGGGFYFYSHSYTEAGKEKENEKRRNSLLSQQTMAQLLTAAYADDRRNNMMYPDLQAVRIYAETYTRIPVYTVLDYEQDDILDLYAMLRGPYSFFLESGVLNSYGRYSIIALPCNKRLISNDGTTRLIQHGEAIQLDGNPLDILKKEMQESAPIYPELPVFSGGAIGHFNYDMIRLFEPIQDHQLPSLELPLMQFAFVQELLVLDHEQHRLYIIVNMQTQNEELKTAYQKAVKRILELKDRISCRKPYYGNPVAKRSVTSSMDKKQFMDKVGRAQEHIHEGDIFQVVLSQRMEAAYTEDPLDAYMQLRKLGKSPYMYYLDFDEYVIAGASPELLLKGRGRSIMTMPIAGTRPRGANEQEDHKAAQSLLEDPKENAEHNMLVDLGRNDIGKVSETGSVRVQHMKQVQHYSHVMHMTSEIHGQLKEGCDIFDALASVLPAGTLSGAPKISAMNIIEKLEPVKREIYGGAIGFLGYNKQFDACITIRTFVFHKHKVYLQAGAGIVKDSVPEKEYEETLHKAKAMLRAVHGEVTV